MFRFLFQFYKNKHKTVRQQADCINFNKFYDCDNRRNELNERKGCEKNQGETSRN